MERLFWLITGPLFYASALVFIVAVGRKIYEYATMPRHLRWDIYPVPHQGIEGSKYQKVDFYKQPYHVAKEEEMKEMLPEMLFIKKMYVNNFKLWQGSWLLHMGVYMLFLWLALVVVGALLNALGFEISLANRSWLITAFVYLTAAAGWAGTIAGVVGTVMLLWRRYTDKDLKDMSDAVTYLNLYVVLFVFGITLLALITVDPVSSILRSHLATLLVGSPGTVSQPAIVLQLLIWGFFLLYLPFSRMAHFTAKFFFYHQIMWDDEPMKGGSKLEQNVIHSLYHRPSWSASHIKQSDIWLNQADLKRKEEEPHGEKG